MQLVAGELLAGEKVPRQARKSTRADARPELEPLPRPRGARAPAASLLAEFAAALAGWAWDVALLQEVPPWWPEPLARAAGASERHVLTSRNALPALRRALGRALARTCIKSNGGGANAILVRGAAIAEHRALRAARRPERRVRPRRAARRRRLGRSTSTRPPTRRSARGADVDQALAALGGRGTGWSSAATSTCATRELPGLLHAAGRDVDHLFARGLHPAGAAEVLERGGSPITRRWSRRSRSGRVSVRRRPEVVDDVAWSKYRARALAAASVAPSASTRCAASCRRKRCSTHSG